MDSHIQLIVYESEDDFDQYVKEHTVIADFQGQEEAAYEKSDYSLALRLDSIFEERFGLEAKDELYYQNYDWWPNHTRGFEVGIECINLELLKEIQGALVGDYEDWKVYIGVFASLEESNESLGEICIYADRVIVRESIESLINR